MRTLMHILVNMINWNLILCWPDGIMKIILGQKEATEAGKLLKAHDVQFDIMYTSWLSRAIETGAVFQGSV